MAKASKTGKMLIKDKEYEQLNIRTAAPKMDKSRASPSITKKATDHTDDKVETSVHATSVHPSVAKSEHKSKPVKSVSIDKSARLKKAADEEKYESLALSRKSVSGTSTKPGRPISIEKPPRLKKSSEEKYESLAVPKKKKKENSEIERRNYREMLRTVLEAKKNDRDSYVARLIMVLVAWFIIFASFLSFLFVGTELFKPLFDGFDTFMKDDFCYIQTYLIETNSSPDCFE